MEDLTEKQQWLVAQLPASLHTLEDRSSVGSSALKSRISRIREVYDDDDIIEWVPSAREYTWNGDPEVKQNLSTRHKGQITRDANDWLTTEEDRLRHLINRVGIPENRPDPDPSHEDVVIAISDIHIGDVIENLDDTVIHNTDLVELMVDAIFNRAFELIERQEHGGVVVDTVHVNLNGDIITNENIYQGHFEVLDRFLNRQKATAVDLLERNLLRVADRYPRVQVNCQVGNHGEDRANASSRQANADLHVYRELAGRIQTRKSELEDLLQYAPDEAPTTWIEDALEKYESFDFNFNNAKYMTKISLRGGEWEGLLTHGQDMYEQITGTAASNDAVKSLMIDQETQFDVAWVGHYHEARKVKCMGKEIMRTGSPKPPDDWAKVKTGAGLAPGMSHSIATVHGVSDQRPVTWYYEVDDKVVDEYAS